ncbi:MAG TPA: TetR family transcriptional regulator [Rhizomicrobium sp.]
MGLAETRPAEAADDRTRLLEAARALVLRGDAKFSVAAVCAEAGVERVTFRAHFPGKTALMAALMQQDEPQSDLVPDLAAAIESAPAAPPDIPAEAAAQPDAWLERRLRVFERALTALEAKAETKARQLDLRVSQLEEQLAALGQPPRPAQPAPRRDPFADPVLEIPAEPMPEFRPAAPEPETAKQPDPGLVIPPLPVTAMSRAEMAEVLQSARDKARSAVVEEPPKKKSGNRLRWLTIGGLSLVALFICIGLTLGNTARATQAALGAEGSGVTARHVAAGGLARTVALADAGDPGAQAGLALAYLRGTGVTKDPGAAARWSAAAAQAGEPVAQYLLGAMYGQGDGVAADPVRAFAWFAQAASHGNLKAMHNLAIAYAQGQGAQKDEAKAAEWFARAAARGYVDSAFDLAVLYERGRGVKQDLAQALTWYDIAARQGDAPSRARADFLRGQLDPARVQLAVNAAQAFAPLAAPAAANTLPAF